VAASNPFYELVEERLARAAETQAVRHQRLEEAVRRLAQRLEPLLQADNSTVEPKRLERLNDKVQGLVETLYPVFEIDADVPPTALPGPPAALPAPPAALPAPLAALPGSLPEALPSVRQPEEPAAARSGRSGGGAGPASPRPGGRPAEPGARKRDGRPIGPTSEPKIGPL